jgi:hypothetical protein
MVMNALRLTSPLTTSRLALGVISASALVALLALAGSGAGTASASPTVAAAPPQAAALRLRALNVRDRLAGTSAFRMLIPSGWRARGGVVWDFRYHTLASAVMEVRAPTGPEALQTFPLFPHVWDSQGIFGFPEGSNYLGAVVSRPRSAVEYLEQMVIPTFRGRTNARVIERVRLTNVIRAATARTARSAFPSKATFDAGRVRIAYTQGGRAIEEDFYTLVYYWTSPLLPGRLSWTADSLYSFRAARGRLNRSAGLLHAMVSSVRVDLRWYAGYRHVQQLWVDGQMQAIRAAGALSRQIARANDEITASIRSSYRAQQDSSDRISNSFSERIRGVETYEQPFEGTTVQLPSDYSHAWASARGEYVFSDSPGFNPNVGSTVEWRLLKTA